MSVHVVNQVVNYVVEWTNNQLEVDFSFTSSAPRFSNPYLTLEPQVIIHGQYAIVGEHKS